MVEYIYNNANNIKIIICTNLLQSFFKVNALKPSLLYCYINKCIPALTLPTWIEFIKKMHSQLCYWNAPLTFQSFMAASMNLPPLQYEMRGPIMKCKNRNKHLVLENGTSST